jgi:hypothetical protein
VSRTGMNGQQFVAELVAEDRLDVHSGRLNPILRAWALLEDVEVCGRDDHDDDLGQVRMHGTSQPAKRVGRVPGVDVPV